MSPVDPFLTLPLDGVQAIEASAGTGKTFTLATLVLRLVIERRLRIGQVLAVTFTEAATQELRTRIRERLVLARACISGEAGAAGAEADLTRAVIDAHLTQSVETAAALHARLDAAVQEIDLAAIFTIHGFCARVLREHALESGQGFDAPELLTGDSALRASIAADLWRAHGADDTAADDLSALWSGGYAALADDLRPLLRERVLHPGAQALPADPTPRLRAAAAALADAVRAHGDTFRAGLLAAVESKVLNNTSYRAAWIESLFDALARWCDAGRDGAFEHEKLSKLTRDALLAGTSKAGAGRTPDSAICAAVSDHLDALAALVDWHDARRVALLHALRDDARARMAAAKHALRVQGYDDLIDRVADALEGPHAEALVERLRAQYAVALVDEFQDTDARQWRIFERVFGAASGAPALFVIGDPKQAIYGFRGGDVHTYLAATRVAEAAPKLASNFRSRPGVLQAIDALYAQAGPAAFVEPGIDFIAVQPGGARGDGDHLRDGVPAPALTLWQAPAPPADSAGKVKPYSAGRSRALATAACVAAIHDVLSDARAGRATLKAGEAMRPVQPGDIAVLVRSHAEATRIRDALAAAGIPAVAAGKQSLLATLEARELHLLLLALLHGDDVARLRAALATVLVGLDAAGIATLDAAALDHWQATARGWRERLRRGGPVALVGDLASARAGALLQLVDGERRLTNLLQLAELLQQAAGRVHGLHGLVDWLARAIAEADSDDDEQLLRLESDAQRVQVVTLHKSKGLEYPLVFLPFAAIGATPKTTGRHLTVQGAGGRALHWKLLPAQSGWDDAKARAQAAQRAEDARLLYVGLTRARDALWVATGAFASRDKAAIAPMLKDLPALAAALGTTLHIDTREPPATLPWLPPHATEAVPAARMPRRALASDWWVHSFTQLAHADAPVEVAAVATQAAPGGRDEPATDSDDRVPAPDATPFDPRFGGTRFGVVLHDVLEHADFAVWRDWQPGDAAPHGEAARIAAALARGGYAAADIDAGIDALVPLAGATLTAPLPEGTRLCDVPAHERRAEIEFQFALAPTRVDALLALLHRHGVLRARTGFGARRVLEGLMTGLIDLTYRVDGRWYVLDYKSNRLPRYDAVGLREAMARSEYDLQALLYTLALHRWLRFRLGAGYDYARDFGGVRYVFCRGLDPRDAAPGMHAFAFPPDLVHALDALFAQASTP